MKLQKDTSCDVTTCIDHQNRSTGATCAHDRDQKIQRKKADSGKLDIRREHPRR